MATTPMANIKWNTSKLTIMCYMTIIDASAEYYSLKIDQISAYFTRLKCLFCRYRFTRLAFGVVPADDMFHQKTNKIFKDSPNVVSIVGNILIVGYTAGGSDHIMQIHYCINIKLNKINAISGTSNYYSLG